jgi:asparagine synthase (glutamine-hydrolysing)
MCGIAGYLDTNNLSGAADMHALAGAMADALAHRGPDDRGTWVDPESGIALGHRRLSIIDISSAGHQPMVSASGRFAIVFNGEVYNYLQILDELKTALGMETRLRGHSDTEVILTAFDHWGVEWSLPRLTGMFAMAVWDRHERALWFASDRFGKKPLYYGRFAETVLFASELKALRVHPSFRAELDNDALASYLRYNCIPAPRSIFRGVHKLPAASWLRISGDGAETGPHAYWSLDELARSSVASPFNGSEEEAVEELDLRLRAAIRSRMLASDVPVGLFLSGGVDSSTVTALAQAQSSIPIRTFCIGMSSSAYDESKFAGAVAQYLGTNHTEWVLSAPEAMSVVAKLPAIFDEPFADASAIPTFLVSQLARKQVTVALSGDGGDEMFGGYNRHIMATKLWPAISALPRSARLQIARVLGSIPAEKLESVASLVVPEKYRLANLSDKLHKIRRVTGAHNSRDLYLKLISNWENPAEVLNCDSETEDIPEVVQNWLHDDKPTESMMFADARLYMHDDILVKVDRASMAVSLEVRNPFLDPAVVEFAWRLPLRFKVGEGVGKLIVRKVMSRYIPADLTDRPKMGFAIPVAQWLRGPLREWADSLLKPPQGTSEGLLKDEVVQNVWADFLAGRTELTDKIWSLLMLRGWLVYQTSAADMPAHSSGFQG